MGKIIALCSTPYQIMCALRIAEEKYVGASLDILLTDTISNVDNVYKKMSEESAIHKVYLWNAKGRICFNRLQKVTYAFLGAEMAKRKLKEFDKLEDVYDVYLFANLSPVAMCLGDILRKENPKIEVAMYEDGFSTYSSYTGNFYKNKKQKVLKKFFFTANKLYLFHPEILEWKPEFEVQKITPVFKGETLKLINRIFEYDSLEDDYKKKVIFFEESYAGDGRPVDDVEMLDVIAQEIGKENIIVKIHPRNPINRFAQKGYITNKNRSIPWEVILINEKFEDTVFVTMASNAAMNPFFLFGKTNKAILLYKCTKMPESMYPSIVEFDDRLCSQYPEIFVIPESMDELKDVLK